MQQQKILRSMLGAAVLLLSSCGDVNVYDVDTKFSQAIHVEPVTKSRKTVYVRIRDLTGYASELATSIESQLKREGYRLVADPSDANFKLMVNVIKFGTGNSEDQITFMQAVAPEKAAQLSIEKNKVRNIRRNTNVYQKKDPYGFFHTPYGQRNNDIYADDEIIEHTSIAPYADRTGIADIEIINTNGRHLKTRLMVGVNLRGGLFAEPKPEVDHWGWNRLIQRFAQAVSSMF